MNKEKYTFPLNPFDFQPTGHCDFSKMYPKSATLTYTDVNGNKIIEHYTVVNNDLIDGHIKKN